MTIKEQFAEVMKMSFAPEKDMNKTLFLAKCWTLMAAIEDKSQHVDGTVFECLSETQARDILTIVVGMFGTVATAE